jgi:hypothetical protein
VAAVVGRLFDMAISGLGCTRILKTLVKEKVPPLTRECWSRAHIRWVLTNRAVLGEHQPCRREGNKRIPDGDAIEGYYPQIITPDRFAQAQAALGNRRYRQPARTGKGPCNLFAGMIREAGTGTSFQLTKRVDRGRTHYVLMSYVKAGGSVSVPYEPFERAILGRLEEVDPHDLLPPSGAGDEVLRLRGEQDAVDLEIAAIVADLDREYSSELNGVLNRKREKRNGIATRLAEASLLAASSLSEAWGDAKSLIGLIDRTPADERATLLLRLRAVLRLLIEGMTMLVVRRGQDCLVAVQVWFATGKHKGECRSYLILHRPPKSNGKATTEGGTWCRSLADVHRTGDLDLCKPEHAARLEAVLAAVDLAPLAEQKAG